MRIISRRALVAFCQRPDCRDAKGPLDAWYHFVKREQWTSWTDIKAQYADASILKGGRVVFNIGGNKYRLVVHVNYPSQRVYIRFVGTHKEYNKIDAEVI